MKPDLLDHGVSTDPHCISVNILSAQHRNHQGALEGLWSTPHAEVTCTTPRCAARTGFGVEFSIPLAAATVEDFTKGLL